LSDNFLYVQGISQKNERLGLVVYA
jgi:hypothetical protein